MERQSPQHQRKIKDLVPQPRAVALVLAASQYVVEGFLEAEDAGHPNSAIWGMLIRELVCSLFLALSFFRS